MRHELDSKPIWLSRTFLAALISFLIALAVRKYGADVEWMKEYVIELATIVEVVGGIIMVAVFRHKAKRPTRIKP